MVSLKPAVAVLCLLLLATACRQKVVPVRSTADPDIDAVGSPDTSTDAMPGPDVELADSVQPTPDVALLDSAIPEDAPDPLDQMEGPDAAADASEPIDVGDPICPEAAPGPRQIRLLTRREYDATVRDLLGAGGAKTACAGDAGCDVLTESCVGGTCTSDPCAVHTFAFDPQGVTYATVHVAGDFNAWAPSPTGGLPLTWAPTKGLWIGKRTFDSGKWLYKYVLNGQTWVADPKSAAVQPDGFGGSNTVLTVACGSGGVLAATPSADFPLESRPDGFAFDDHASSAVVTAVHVERYLAAGEAIANALDPAVLLDGCASPAVECAELFVTAFGQRAFRRPLTEVEIARYVNRILAAPSLPEGVRIAVRVLLSSPYFLYRFELGHEGADGTYDLDGWELASALSYFLTGTMPDELLMAAAAADQLDTVEGIEAEAIRLLALPAARTQLGVFATQWLGLERLQTADKSALMFPGWSAALRDAMLEETRRFVAHVAFDSTGRMSELFTADSTFVDALLRTHYGLPASADPAFAKASAAPERLGAGLLGHASVLAATSHSDQSSPIRRGLFVRRALLCQELGAPPPEAGGVPEVDPNATTRERFKQHSATPFCQGCHQFVDELGFGFETFDATGAWRTSENGTSVDPNGNLNDVEYLGSGTKAPYSNLGQLADALVSSKVLGRCFTKQLVRFASGRLETSADECTFDQLGAEFAATDGDIQALVVRLVTSRAFRVRQP